MVKKMVLTAYRAIPNDNSIDSSKWKKNTGGNAKDARGKLRKERNWKNHNNQSRKES
jgi:hypothetical protein